MVIINLHKTILELRTSCQAYSKVKTPAVFGEDVAVTPASGSLHVKKIYHAALEQFKDEASAEVWVYNVLFSRGFQTLDASLYC